jgi:hypothetical protein
MNCALQGFVSAEANFCAAKVKASGTLARRSKMKLALAKR